MPSITASSFRTRMALLNGFGLIKSTDDEVGLTELGLDLVQDFDENKRQEARRSAVLKLKAYREVVETFDGTELLPRDKLAAKFKFEYSKTDEFAGQAADALIDSLRFARILDDSNVVHQRGVTTTLPRTNGQGSSDAIETEAPVNDDDSAPDEVNQSAEPMQSDEDAAAAELDDAFGGNVEQEPPLRITRHQGNEKGADSVSLDVTLDLSSFRAEEVIQILRALGLAKL